MKMTLKRLLSLFLVLAMVMCFFPVLSANAAENTAKNDTADKNESKGPTEKLEYVYTDEDNALIENDVFSRIGSVKTSAAQKMGGIEKMTETDYVRLLPEVIEAVKTSDTYVPGTLQQNGNMLIWETTVGIPCCYSPRMEAQLHNTENAPTPEEIAAVERDAESLLEDYPVLRGGNPTAKDIGLIQPYWESNSSYSDSSFTSYSPYYKTMWQNLYGATGGSGVRYSMTNATVDNIAKTMEQCGLVIFDSHGTTDYEGSNEDYTSRANCSYLCLTTNSFGFRKVKWFA